MFQFECQGMWTPMKKKRRKVSKFKRRREELYKLHGNYYKEMLDMGLLNLEEDEMQYNNSNPSIMLRKQQTISRAVHSSRDNVQKHFNDIEFNYSYLTSTIPINANRVVIHPPIPRIHHQHHFSKGVSERMPDNSSSLNSMTTYLSSYHQPEIGLFSAGQFSACEPLNNFPPLFSTNSFEGFQERNGFADEQQQQFCEHSVTFGTDGNYFFIL